MRRAPAGPSAHPDPGPELLLARRPVAVARSAELRDHVRTDPQPPGQGAGTAPQAVAPDPEAVPLTTADAAEMLDLVARTDPGPFRKRTVELGRYLGIRRDGRLIAMAGERLRCGRWIEISAVCTDPAFRGQGLAGRLTRAVAHGIREQGGTPFLAATAANTGALRLYRALGFTYRRDVTFAILRAPGG